MALKNWERALQFLEIVIMSPANNTASLIQVEAYKKRVLVGLLYKGRVSIIITTFFRIMALTIVLVRHYQYHEPRVRKRQSTIER